MQGKYRIGEGGQEPALWPGSTTKEGEGEKGQSSRGWGGQRKTFGHVVIPTINISITEVHS